MTENAFTVCDGILDIFRAYGAEYIFSSPGSEWSPLWDALARAGAEGQGPRFLNTRHEELAVSLGAGYYRQSRKLPVVLLHTTVGTLHGAMALRSARHERIPMVVMSGDSAGFGEMAIKDPGPHWVGQLADIGGSAAMAQPCVKRSSTVTCREVLPGMVQDACRLALTPPLGPVFLAVPLEFMLGPCSAFGACCTPPPVPPRADDSILEDVARQLVQAKRPVLLTTYAGRNPENVAPLVELAESLALPVAEGASADCFNFPKDHPLHQGFGGQELLSDADLVLAIACDRPWYPASRRPTNARVILMDDDLSYELLPYWGYGADQIVAGDLNSSLRGLNAAVKRLASGPGLGEGVLSARLGEWTARHERLREKRRAELRGGELRRPMDGNWVSFTLGELLPESAIVAEEVITHKPGLLRHLKRNLAGTYHSRVSGGLGVGIGKALGLKLAAPDRLVALVVGDGSFNYNPVLAAFGFAQQFETPILVVLMNNRGYAAMKRAHLGTLPEGWSVRTGTFFGAEIEPAPDYAAIARAFGGYGERVEEPADLPGAIKRAMERVEGGQLALLDVIVENEADLAYESRRA